MIKGKIAGIAIGGFAGYLLISKTMNVIRSIVLDVCTANEWKNYYKYGKDGNMVAPGYSMHTHVDGEGNKVTVKDENQTKVNGSQAPLETALKDSVIQAIKDTFDKPDAPKEAVEGQTEASEGQNHGDADGDDPFDEEANCPKMTNPEKFMQYVQNCQEKRMSDAEIALSLGMSIDVYRKTLADALGILQERPDTEEKEPMYADDLYDGVKVVDPDESVTDEEMESMMMDDLKKDIKAKGFIDLEGEDE